MLNYEPKYRRRVKISGQVFRFSILAIILLLVVRVAAGIDEPVLTVSLGFAVLGLLAGVFGSATRTINLQVERKNDA